jgi:hypothetical protein
MNLGGSYISRPLIKSASLIKALIVLVRSSHFSSSMSHPLFAHTAPLFLNSLISVARSCPTVIRLKSSPSSTLIRCHFSPTASASPLSPIPLCHSPRTNSPSHILLTLLSNFNIDQNQGMHPHSQILLQPIIPTIRSPSLSIEWETQSLPKRVHLKT